MPDNSSISVANPDYLSPAWARAALLVVGVHSLIWWYGIGDALARPFSRLGDFGHFLAWSGVPALCSVLLVYVCIRPARSYCLPLKETPWLTVGILVAVTSFIAIALIFGTDLWIPAIVALNSLIVFVFIGPLFEEILFRGVAFELAERAFPEPRIKSLGLAVILSSVLFGLAHWHYHGFRLSEGALSQIAYSFLEGLVFGSLRALSTSLWPSISLHVFINLIACLR